MTCSNKRLFGGTVRPVRKVILQIRGSLSRCRGQIYCLESTITVTFLLLWFRALCAGGCNVNVRTARGETALHLAVTARKASGNSHDLVSALLEAGCDANIQDNLQRRTALHALVRPLAVSVADPNSGTYNIMLETFEQLARKSDVNLQDHRQRTPLHRLAASGCTHLQTFQVRARSN